MSDHLEPRDGRKAFRMPVSRMASRPTSAPQGRNQDLVEQPNRPLQATRARTSQFASPGVAMAAMMVAVAVMLALMWQWSPEGTVTALGGGYLPDDSVVVASDRLVCSMAGGQQETAGILGQDGSHSVSADGVVFWNFGDTLLANGAMIPNSVAWSADSNAADCISLVPKSAVEGAVSLLPGQAPELTVWPAGMEETAPGIVHFFYASVVGKGFDDWEVAGVGLASFDTKTLTAKRAFDGELPWPAGLPQPMRTISEGGYVYVLLGTAQHGWSTDTILARVPSDDIESLGAYEYWQPSHGADPGHWVADLWDANRAAWRPELNQIDALWSQAGLHNGVQVSYNQYLGRWLAVYSSGFMTSISFRSAEDLTGPWDGPEATLIDCQTYHPPQSDGFLCYSGAQQDVYTQDGGRTIYVSYSNGASYKVYLHEIRFASPIVEWTDRVGHALYVPSGAEGPAGFRRGAAAFHASDIPAPGFVPIHRWADPKTNTVRYGAIAFGAGYRDLGIDFYAPVERTTAEAANALYAPVYRWSNEGKARYAALDLTDLGWKQHEVAFFAACPDSDSDALSDCEESFLKTDALLADTDGDGLRDGYEQTMPGCDPLVYNDDRDGTSSIEEVLQGLNPCVWGTGARDVLSAAIGHSALDRPPQGM